VRGSENEAVRAYVAATHRTEVVPPTSQNRDVGHPMGGGL